MKLQLINAPIPADVIPSTRSGIFPPVNLIALYTHLRSVLPEVEVEILDGDILSLQNILANINGDYIGIGSTIMSYENALTIARQAKSRDAIVIFGGQHVSSIWPRILENRPEVDFVVLGDGETALEMLLKKQTLETIPNLAYRDPERQYRSNPVLEHPFEKLSISDYTGINLRGYANNFKNQKIFNGYTNCGGIYVQKGCSWQAAGGGCLFCRRGMSGHRLKKPEFVWKEIINLYENFQIDFFHDVSDEFPSNMEWLEVFASQKISTISPGFFVFARADQITPRSTSLLKKIGCVEVLLGVETGTDRMLKKARKPVTVNDNKKATLFLSEVGIQVYPTFLFGLPGETRDTIERTMRLAEDLVSYGNISELSCSILLPIPSSPSFDMLCKDEKIKKKFNTDLLEPDELRQCWVDMFCNVPMEVLETAVMRISEITPIANQFGMRLPVAN